jgi:hypothetical protein
VRITNTSGSVFVINGVGTDVVSYQCAGN